MPSGDLTFNASHSGARALIAVSRGREVGIGVERERDLDVLGLAGCFFASRECRRLAAMSSPQQQRAFFRYWARKESFVKALGCGLSLPLDTFEVDSESRRQQIVRHHTGRQTVWRISAIPIDAGYAAALTFAERRARVFRWRLPWPSVS